MEKIPSKKVSVTSTCVILNKKELTCDSILCWGLKGHKKIPTGPKKGPPTRKYQKTIIFWGDLPKQRGWWQIRLYSAVDAAESLLHFATNVFLSDVCTT